MHELHGIGRVLMGLGLVMFLVGAVLFFGGRVSGWSWFGRLPGDIMIVRGRFRFFFPLMTSIVISAVFSVIVWLLTRR